MTCPPFSRKMCRLMCFLLLSQASFVCESFAQRSGFPEPVLQTGQTQEAWSMAISPDGKTLATASGYAVNLWDPVNGWLLATLIGHTGYVRGVAFSPDGKTLASVSQNGELATWNVETGGREVLRAANQQTLEAVSYSSNTEIVTVGWDQTIRIWDQSDCAQSCIAAQLDQTPTSLAISADRTRVAVGTTQNAVSVWQWSGRTFSKMNNLVLPLPESVRTKDSHVRSVGFDDHNRLAAVNFEGTVVLQSINPWETVWSQQTGLRLDGLTFNSDRNLLYVAGSGAAFAGRALSFVVSDGTPNPLDEVETPGNAFRSMAISRDGHWLFACGGAITRWDLTKRLAPAFFGMHSIAAPGFSTSLSPRATFIASAFLGLHAFSLTHSRSTYGEFDPQLLKALPSGTGPPVVNQDERFIAVLGLNPPYVDRLRQTCGGNATSVVFMECSTKLSADQSVPPQFAVLLFQRSTLNLQRVLVPADLESRYFFSSDNKQLFWTHEAHLSSVDLDCLCNVRDIDGLTPPVEEGYFPIDINQHGDTVAFPKAGTNDSVITLFSLTGNRQGQEIALGGSRLWMRTLAFNPRSQNGVNELAVAVSSGEVYLYDTQHPEMRRIIPGNSPSDRLAYSQDGTRLAIARENGDITLVNVSTLKKVEILGAHSSSMSDLKFGFANRWLSSVGTDGTIKFWNYEDGSSIGILLIRVANFGRLSWIFLRPDGLFEGEPSAFSSVMWRFSQRVHDIRPVEIFFKDYYRRGLIQATLLDGLPPKALPVSRLNRMIPTVLMTTDAALDKAVSTDHIKVHLHVLEATDGSGRGSGIRDIRLFRNGTLIKHWHRGFDREATVNFDAPVAVGANEYSAYAFNRDNVKSLDAHLDVLGSPSLVRTGTRYILAIGVGNYASPIPKLSYSTNDARSFADSVGRTYDPRHLVSIVLADKEATEENIRCALSRFADAQFAAQTPCKLEQLNALQPARLEDSIFVLFSGHGISEAGHFFALPADASLVRSSKVSHAISDQAFGDLFEPILASHIVLVLDACGSGQLLPHDANELGPLNVGSFTQLAYDKGMNILAATTQGQAAMESPSDPRGIEHSILNYVMIEEGLTARKADLSPRDGTITIEELFEYTASHVPNVADQQPQAFFPLRREGNPALAVTTQ